MSSKTVVVHPARPAERPGASILLAAAPPGFADPSSAALRRELLLKSPCKYLNYLDYSAYQHMWKTLCVTRLEAPPNSALFRHCSCDIPWSFRPFCALTPVHSMRASSVAFDRSPCRRRRSQACLAAKLVPDSSFPHITARNISVRKGICSLGRHGAQSDELLLTVLGTIL